MLPAPAWAAGKALGRATLVWGDPVSHGAPQTQEQPQQHSTVSEKSVLAQDTCLLR